VQKITCVFVLYITYRVQFWGIFLCVFVHMTHDLYIKILLTRFKFGCSFWGIIFVHLVYAEVTCILCVLLESCVIVWGINFCKEMWQSTDVLNTMLLCCCVKSCSWNQRTFHSSWSATGRSYWRNTALLRSMIDREVWRLEFVRIPRHLYKKHNWNQFWGFM